jgi:PAS domain S-box-containing protein
MDRERFAQLFEQSPSLIAVLTGPDHIFEFVNLSFLKLVGHRDVLGKSVVAAIPELVEQGHLDLLNEVFQTGVASSATDAAITLKGSPATSASKRFLEFAYQPIRDTHGRITGIFVEGVDVSARLASDEALRRREEQLRLATESSEVGLWDVDPIADKLYWPPRVKAMFGISPDAEVSMADFYAGLHPEDHARTVASYAAACDPAVRSLYDAEYRTIGKEDGVIRWVAAKGRAQFNDRGECIRVIGTAIDITARKSAAIRETFLLGLLDRLRHLSEPAAIIAEATQALGRHIGANRVGYGQMQDDDSAIVLETCYVNGVSPITGQFPVDSFGAHSIACQRRGETVVVSDVEADARNNFDLWAGIETRAFVSVPLVRDGRFRASLFVNRRDPYAWSGHEITLIEEVARRLWDAVERARAEESLRIVKASLEQQVEARTRERDRTWRLSPVVMVVGDKRGILMEANPAWVKTLGWTLEETLGRDVMEFVAPADREAGAAGMAELFEGRPVVEYRLAFLHKGGWQRTIAWTTVPEGDRLYGFGRDITEQMLAEEQLRQSQKMDALGRLTGGIAHDFNNLLQGVTGSLDLIRRKPFDENKVRQWAEAGLNAAQRGSKLTSQLLAFSRAQELELKSVRVRDLVEKMCDLEPGDQCARRYGGEWRAYHCGTSAAFEYRPSIAQRRVCRDHRS